MKFESVIPRHELPIKVLRKVFFEAGYLGIFEGLEDGLRAIIGFAGIGEFGRYGALFLIGGFGSSVCLGLLDVFGRDLYTFGWVRVLWASDLAECEYLLYWAFLLICVNILAVSVTY